MLLDQKLLNDVTEYLIENTKFDLPDNFLKKWMRTAGENKLTQDEDNAFIGGLIGFLWYNTFPAQIFMGDTGSLTIGGIIAVLAIIVRKELLLPLICGVFLIETLSVIIQVGFFKYTKKTKGLGERIFLMSPLHHHYQITLRILFC